MLLKLVITLTILGAGNFGTSNATQPIETYDNRVVSLMVSPETAIYYVDRLNGTNETTVTRKVNVFDASPSYLYYNNPENSRDNTFIRNIIVVCDWSTVRFTNGEIDLVDDTIKHLDFAARKFDKIKLPKIKLHLTEIIIPKGESVFDIPIVSGTRKYYFGYEDLVSSESAFKYIRNWLGDNKDSFEGLSYDFFWYRPGMGLKNEITGEEDATTYFTSHNCRNNGGSSYPSGAIVNAMAHTSYYQVVQMIAQSFAVKNDKDLGCTGIMELGILRSDWMSSEWSNCSKTELQRIVDDSDYSCYKMPTKLSNVPNPASPVTSLLLGQSTQIYLINYSSDHQLIIQRSGPIFEDSASWEYYLNLDNDRSNTYVQNILLILDYRLREVYNEENDFVVPILQILEKAAVKLNQIESPKIKLRITGIIKPEHPDVLELPALEESHFWHMPCLPLLGTLHQLSTWLKDNEESFRTVPYDLYMFASTYPLCNESNLNKIENSPVVAYGCNALGYKSGGLFHYAGFYSNVYAAQVVAKTFGVETDEQVGCGSDHIMFSKEQNSSYFSNYTIRSWSDCSKRAFQKNVHKHVFSCFKMM